MGAEGGVAFAASPGAAPDAAASALAGAAGAGGSSTFCAESVGGFVGGAATSFAAVRSGGACDAGGGAGTAPAGADAVGAAGAAAGGVGVADSTAAAGAPPPLAGPATPAAGLTGAASRWEPKYTPATTPRATNAAPTPSPRMKADVVDCNADTPAAPSCAPVAARAGCAAAIWLRTARPNRADGPASRRSDRGFRIASAMSQLYVSARRGTRKQRAPSRPRPCPVYPLSAHGNYGMARRG